MRQHSRVIAIFGGLGAAFMWGISNITSSRSSRAIGPISAVGWVAFVGLVMTLPLLVAAGPVPELSAGTLLLMLGAGVAGIVGGFLFYRALRLGKIGLVSAVTSTEGAVAAVIAVIAGEALGFGSAVMLAVIAVGVVVVALAAGDAEAGPASTRHVDPRDAPRAIAYAGLSALAFGFGLYCTARVGSTLPLAYAVLPQRLVGTVVVFLPLLVARRLRITREALPFVLATALVEVLGTASFALGARQSVAVAAVLASQFAAIAAVAAFVIYHEHLTVRQRSGVVAIAVGVAVLSGLRV